jgi:deazaflavin-dependent oxidoreductase (nitroreductase family)
MAVELPPKGSYGAKMPKPPSWVAKAFTSLNVGFFHLFGKRMRVQGRPLLLLTTVGAKTGQVRQSVLGSFPDGDNAWLIVASAAGAATNPGWLFNLAKNPDKVWIEFGGRTLKVRPESLKGAEREAAWQEVVRLAPGYGAYTTKTDREIPIIRLTPAE